MCGVVEMQHKAAGAFMQLCGVVGERNSVLKWSTFGPSGMQPVSLEYPYIFSSLPPYGWDCALTAAATPARQQMHNTCLVLCAGYLRCCCYPITCGRMKSFPLKQLVLQYTLCLPVVNVKCLFNSFYSISRWFLPRNGSPERPMMT